MLTHDGFRLISNTEVQTFKMCRRKWYQAYYLGLSSRRIDNPASVRAMGTRIHEALAAYYVPAGTSPTHPVEAHSGITVRELDALHANAALLGYEVDVKPLHTAFEMERVMLNGYMEWLYETGADSDLEIIASEQYLEAEILPGVKIIGKLDARTRSRSTGRRRFMDHKSVAGFISAWELRLNPQMKHYHILELLNTPPGEPSCDGALYNQLKRSKRTAKATPPFYVREAVPHNKWEIQTYREQLEGTIMEIMWAEQALDAGGSHHRIVPPTPSDACSWKCPFNQVCNMFDDGSRVEAALTYLFEKQNPLDYYKGSERQAEEGP